MDTKLWHYTCRNDDSIWPVGYCSNNCPGHATAEEAQEHYKQYLLDERVYISTNDDTMRKCKECGEWTSDMLMVDGWPRFDLCKAHQIREVYEKLVKVGSSASS